MLSRGGALEGRCRARVRAGEGTNQLDGSLRNGVPTSRRYGFGPSGDPWIPSSVTAPTVGNRRSDASRTPPQAWRHRSDRPAGWATRSGNQAEEEMLDRDRDHRLPGEDVAVGACSQTAASEMSRAHVASRIRAQRGECAGRALVSCLRSTRAGDGAHDVSRETAPRGEVREDHQGPDRAPTQFGPGRSAAAPLVHLLGCPFAARTGCRKVGGTGIGWAAGSGRGAGQGCGRLHQVGG
jgi:hypothetical protein